MNGTDNMVGMERIDEIEGIEEMTTRTRSMKETCSELLISIPNF